jgi:CheY-like chemotaxis protein
MFVCKWLLIDDDLDDQEIFCLAAKEVDQAIKCTCENSGIEALAKLNEGSFVPDCIFIDMNMPRMNGRQCLIEIKKINHLSNVPIYMCSTSSDPSVIAETKMLGAVDFIVKPSTLGEFTKTLSSVFERLQA